jgi:hypothetical protein
MGSSSQASGRCTANRSQSALGQGVKEGSSCSALRSLPPFNSGVATVKAFCAAVATYKRSALSTPIRALLGSSSQSFKRCTANRSHLALAELRGRTIPSGSTANRSQSALGQGVKEGSSCSALRSLPPFNSGVATVKAFCAAVATYKRSALSTPIRALLGSSSQSLKRCTANRSRLALAELRGRTIPSGSRLCNKTAFNFVMRD